ncbi:MAG: ion transporter [Gammaproteobacteria bacterium]|nr:MAG: ion transporter [Gammaproteobacteria bacterium]
MSLAQAARGLAEATGFQRLIVGLIVFNGAIVGLETYPAVAVRWGDWLATANRLCLAVFTVEIAVRLAAFGARPWRFFRDGWNVFDFVVVGAAYLPGLAEEGTLLRLVRLLRVLRLLSTVPSLQMMVTALVRSIPRIGQMALLAGLLFYIYAVAGTSLFGDHDPRHWGSLHVALLSLFRTLTLEDWTDLMYTAMELHPWAWAYFVSFVLLGTFIIFNMLIGIILNSMEEAREEIHRERVEAAGTQDLDQALHRAKEALAALEQALEGHRHRYGEGGGG